MDANLVNFITIHKDPITGRPPVNPVKVTFNNKQTAFWETRTVELRCLELHNTEKKIDAFIGKPQQLLSLPITCSITEYAIVKIESAAKRREIIEDYVNKNATELGYNYKKLCAISEELLDKEAQEIKQVLAAKTSLEKISKQLNLKPASSKLVKPETDKYNVGRYNFSDLSENLNRNVILQTIGVCVIMLLFINQLNYNGSEL